MAPMYYRGAHAAILVYDITSEESFLDMNSWVEELKKNMTEDLVIHVVGNKLDLASSHRAVPLRRAQEYVTRTLGSECQTHEVSAKEDDGAIEELFLQITQTLVGRKFDTERQRYLKQANPVLVQETPTQKIGVGLTAFGMFFTICGVFMFFDAGLLAIGNVCMFEVGYDYQ
ncbi:unnamed protein product [Umbelopsis sp. WA50703]